MGLSRRIVGFALALFASAIRLRRPTDAASAAPVVLILEPFGMGDVISLEPLIRSLHKHEFEVRMSAQKSWRPLFSRSVISQWLDSQIPWASYCSRAKYRLSSFGKPAFTAYLRELYRIGHGTIGIDPRGDIRSVLLLRLAGCRSVLTLANYLGTDLCVPSFAAEIVPGSDDLKRWQVNMLFLERVLARKPECPGAPCLNLFKTRASAGTRRVGLLPVAPWSGKLWDRDKWVQLIDALSAEGLEALGLCGPSQRMDARNQLGDKVAVEECADIDAWVTKLTGVACLITVDSGPMHLADALGVPVVALFGQGKLPLWAPSGPRSRVITHQGDTDFALCHPIERNASLGRKFMSRISVQEVMAALKSTALYPAASNALPSQPSACSYVRDT